MKAIKLAVLGLMGMAAATVSATPASALGWVRIRNYMGDAPIWYVYIIPAYSAYWGDDWLSGGLTISPGYNRAFIVPDSWCGNVWLRIQTRSGRYAERRGVNVCDGYTWSISD